MGLDCVELILGVESEFGITIDSRDAEQITTVGDLYHYVRARLEGLGAEGSTCQSAHVFYRVRQALGEVVGVDRNFVRPSTAVQELLPLKGRRRAWKQLEHELGLRLPELVVPNWLIQIVFRTLSSMCIGVALIAAARLIPAIPVPAVTWSFFASVLTLVFSISLLAPLSVCVPDTCGSVGGLVGRVVALNYGALVAAGQTFNDRELWEAVRVLVSEHVGVDPNELTEEMSFVDDLRLD